jgi:hypothetical protein
MSPVSIVEGQGTIITMPPQDRNSLCITNLPWNGLVKEFTIAPY